MRVFTFISGLVLLISMVYKWRYRLINVFMAIQSLRKAAIAITMNIPLIRKKLLPSLFRVSNS